MSNFDALIEVLRLAYRRGRELREQQQNEPDSAPPSRESTESGEPTPTKAVDAG